MFHKLARKHYSLLSEQSYPVSYGQEGVYLNLNINSNSQNPYKLYPEQNNLALKEKYLKILHHFSQEALLKKEQIQFAQGTADAIDLIIRVFCEPSEDSILVTNPTFSYYAYRARVQNVLVQDVPLLGNNLNLLNVEKIILSSAKVLFLATPNNPVGTSLNLFQIEEILQGFQGIVVVDEAYIEWTKNSSALKWIGKYDHLIVLRTFSKIWGLAGVRCGALIADESIIRAITLTQNLFPLPTPIADLVYSHLDDLKTLAQDAAQMHDLKRDFINFLRTLKMVKKVYPGDANFLLIEFQKAELVEKKLGEAKILVTNGSYALPNTLRISIGTPSQMCLLKKNLLLMDL